MTKNTQNNDYFKDEINAQLIDEIILPYLKGCSKHAIKNSFITSNDYHITAEDFRNCPIKHDPLNPDEEHEARAKKILRIFNIKSENVQKKYLENDNLYELLCQLYSDEHAHLGCLIDMIDAAKPKFNWFNWLLPKFVISALIATGFFIQEYFPISYNRLSFAALKVEAFILSIIYHATRGIKALTLTSMGYTLLLFGIEVVNTARDNKRNVEKKTYDLSFSLAATLLTLTSYAITYISIGAMSTAAGAIFIASSFVAVVKNSISLYYAHQNYEKYRHKTLHEIACLSPIEHAEYCRKLYRYKAEKTALIQEVIVATLTTLIIASWSLALFFPPGIALVGASMGALIALQSFHSYTSDKVKSYYEDELQKELRSIKGLDEAIEHDQDNSDELSLEDSGIELTTLKTLVSEKTPLQAASNALGALPSNKKPFPFVTEKKHSLFFSGIEKVATPENSDNATMETIKPSQPSI